MPKISSGHTLNVSVAAARAIATPGPGTRYDGAELILDIDRVGRTPNLRRGRVSTVELSIDAPATTSIFAAIDRLAGGNGLDAIDEAAEIAAEHKRLQKLIEACQIERDADPRFVEFPARLPYGPVRQLIETLEGFTSPRPSASKELLVVAYAIKARREAREAAVGNGLQAIIEKARAGELELWGDTSLAAHAETEKLPRRFLLRNITLDCSLKHLGLAQARTNPFLQRAIIAPDGPRSSAYFNVRILRADFERLFRARIATMKLSTDQPEAEQQVRTWYVEQHVPHYQARGEIPNRRQSEEDMKSAFGKLDSTRQILRRCRATLAPASWRARGRRRNQKK